MNPLILQQLCGTIAYFLEVPVVVALAGAGIDLPISKVHEIAEQTAAEFVRKIDELAEGKVT